MNDPTAVADAAEAPKNDGLPDAVKAVPEEPKKVLVSAEDRLRAENINLRMEKLQLEMQVLQQQVQAVVTRRNGLVGEMEKCRAEMQVKYGIDLTRVQINDDGSVTGMQMPPGMGMPGMGRPRA